MCSAGARGIDSLPPEILSRLLDLLGPKDICAARAAHRCLRVHDLDRLHRTMRDPKWLRFSVKRVCQTGRTDVLAFLYARKRVPRSVNMTMLAVESGNMDMLRLVCHHHDAKKVEDALCHAALVGRLDIVRLLCACEGDCVAAKNRALYDATQGGHLDVVRFLLTRGCGHGAGPSIGLALAHGHLDIARALIESDATTWNVSLAICHAARYGRTEIFNLLCDKATEQDLLEAVDIEAGIGDVDLVRLLCERYPALNVDSVVANRHGRFHPHIVAFLEEHRSRVQMCAKGKLE